MKEHEDFSNVLKKEHERLKTRRKEAGLKEGNPEKDAVGLALSGGGIRSATFNLGILQALQRYKIFKHVDYVSTVSGGGYIGSCLTWLTSIFNKFPFGTSRKDHDDIGGKVLAWLRAHGKYLIPGEGLTVWALMGAVLTGIFVNLVILIPVFLAAFYVLRLDIPYVPPLPAFLSSFFLQAEPFAWILALGLVLLAVFIIFMLWSAVRTAFSLFRKFSWQRRFSKWKGGLLKYAALCLIVGTIPIVYGFIAANLQGWIEAIMSTISVSGIISVLVGGRGPKDGREVKGSRSFLLSIGLILIVYGLFLWFYHLVTPGVSYTWLLIWFVVAIVLAVIANINHVSMHRYYRNRLMEAYMPEKGDIEGEKDKEAQKPDYFYLDKIPQTASPYHIINTTITTIGSKNARLAGRGGDNFILSPCFCGSSSTAYVETENYVRGKMDLATAFAISGAAVDPNTYSTRSRPLSFLMTLLNVRLGYWTRNPEKEKKRSGFLRPAWLVYMFREMFGSGLSEDNRSIHLTDGGHFENLALYELIRRRCRYIIVTDSSGDEGFKFNALARLIEMVRLDFGAKIELDTADLVPDEKTGYSKSAFVTGKITYVDDKDNDKAKQADLLFIKTTVSKDIKSQDILSYKKDNPAFPDQSTMDQFYDEQQFEAYRELGFQVGRLVGKRLKDSKVDTIFKK